MVWTMDLYLKSWDSKRPFMTDVNEFESENERNEHVEHMKDLYGAENVKVVPTEYNDTVGVAILWRKQA